MAQQAFVLVDIGEAQAAVELVHEASREAGTAAPEGFRAWLHAAEAEVRAAAGDDLGCRRSFDAAMSNLPPGPDAIDPDMPFIVLNEAHLARWGGHALARIGEAEALDYLYRALSGNGVVSMRAEAALRCDIANAHLIRGELDEARTHAVEARRLARRCGSVRQRRRVDQLALIA